MKRTATLIITGIVIVCILIFCILTVKNIIFLKKSEKTSLQVRVRDGFSAVPVQNARVVVVQSGEVLLTDASGTTQGFYLDEQPHAFANLPVRIRPRWQEVTVLIYHADYVDTVIFHAPVYPHEENIIEAEIFKENDLPGEQVVISCRYPEDGWLQTLLDFYR